MKQGFFQGILSILFFVLVLFPSAALGQDTTQPAPSFQIYTAPRILNVPQPSEPAEETYTVPSTGTFTDPQQPGTMQFNPKALCPYSVTKTKDECDQECLQKHYDCRYGLWKAPHELEMMCQLNLCNTSQTCKHISGICIQGCPIPADFLPDECK